MMTRPFIIAALGSLLVSAPATAERRRASRDDDSRRSLGKVGKVERKNDDSADDVDEDRPARTTRASKKRERKGWVADVEPIEDSDGPEAQAVLPVKLDELIEVAVRLSPELARAKADRTIAKGGAGAARKEQAWILGAEANYAINAVSREVAVDPLQPVREDTAKGALTLGRKLPTGGFFGIELGMTRTGKEIAIPQDYIDALATALGQNAQQGGQQQEIPPEYVTTHQAIAKLTLTQPLARGFGPDVALAAEKRADLQLSEATVKTQLAAEEMIFGVVSGYWELAYLAYAVDTRNEAVILAEAQEKVSRE